MMDKDDLLRQLEEISTEVEIDPIRTQEGHLQADLLLLAFICDEEITAAYTSISRWYA